MSQPGLTGPLRWAAVLLMLVWWLSPGELIQAQCAMCRLGLEMSAEGSTWAPGFQSGILFLIPVPFLLVAVVALVTFRSIKRGDGASPPL